MCMFASVWAWGMILEVVIYIFLKLSTVSHLLTITVDLDVFALLSIYGLSNSPDWAFLTHVKD